MPTSKNMIFGFMQIHQNLQFENLKQKRYILYRYIGKRKFKLKIEHLNSFYCFTCDFFSRYTINSYPLVQIRSIQGKMPNMFL